MSRTVDGVTYYGVEDRKHAPGEVRRPCEDAPGGPSDAAGYMAAAAMGIREELCPFGILVEQFPLMPEGWDIAREHGLWFRSIHPATGEVMDPGDFSVAGISVPCEEADEGAFPDFNEMYRLGLLPTGYGCPVFGHDCPAYYGVEGEA